MFIDYRFHQLFSADRTESLEFWHTQRNELALAFLREIGAFLNVTNPRLAEMLGIEATSEEEAKEELLKALKSGNHVFGIFAGFSSGFLVFNVTDGICSNPEYLEIDQDYLPEDYSPEYLTPEEKREEELLRFKGLNFIVVEKRAFLERYPEQTYKRWNVLKRVQGKGYFFQNSLNGDLVEVYYEGKKKTDAFDFTFADEKQAMEAVAKATPHIRYSEDDFELALKKVVA